MSLFTKAQIEAFAEQQFAYILVEHNDNVLTITLNREAKRNALCPKMVHELAYAISYAQGNNAIWAVVLKSTGPVFCAGAYLKSFMGMTEPHNSTIPDPKEEILVGEIFNKLYKPSICIVQGDVYAGGFFFLAGSNYVVAKKGIKLGLPEVKRGLYPFQVMAALLNVMPARKVIDWCIRGYNLPVKKAHELGLVTHLVKKGKAEEVAEAIIAELTANSPTAIRMGLEAYDHIRQTSTTEQHKYLHHMLLKTLQSKDAQEGLKAFKEKRPAQWTGE